MAAKFMRIRQIVIPILTLVILISQLTGCIPLSQKELAEESANNTDVVLEYSDIDLSNSNKVEIEDESGNKVEFEIDSSVTEENNQSSAQGSETIEYLLGDELTGYFQQVYDHVKGLDVPPEYRIETELIFLAESNATGKELPDDYKERYLDWRPEDAVVEPELDPNLTMQDILPPKQDEETEVPEVIVQDWFQDVEETVYATSTVNIREKATTSSNKLGQLQTAQAVKRVGVGTGEYAGWSEIVTSDGKIAYVNSSYLSTTKPVTQQPSNPQPSNPPAQQPSTPPAQQPSGGNSGVTGDSDGNGIPDVFEGQGTSTPGHNSDHTGDNFSGDVSSDTDHDYSGITIG